MQIMEKPTRPRRGGAEDKNEQTDLLRDRFHALADPTRRRILVLLAASPGTLCVGDLVKRLGTLHQPTVSHHLDALQSVGLIRLTRRDHSRRYYQVCPAALHEVQAEVAALQATVGNEREMMVASRRHRRRP